MNMIYEPTHFPTIDILVSLFQGSTMMMVIMIMTITMKMMAPTSISILPRGLGLLSLDLLLNL